MLSDADRSRRTVLTPSSMREKMHQLGRAVGLHDVPIGEVADRVLPGPGGPLPVRIYTPETVGGRKSAGLIYFHGGAGVFCSIETHDGLCRLLANESLCRVFSVGYRLAPENPFPAAVDDSYHASQWVFENAEALGLDRERIAIGGDSAGATLAAVVCQMAKGNERLKLKLQVLFCPVLDVSRETESRKTYAKGYLFDRETLQWSLQQYCPGEDLTDLRLSPLRASDFSGLPPAHIHTAEFDPFRDEGEAYAARLEQAGVRVTYTCHEGMIHHFYGMAGAITRARGAIRQAGADIVHGLNSSDP
jgi:acetyl esterase